MKNILKYTLLFILLIVGVNSNAQTPITIVKDNNYTVTGSETLTASESITLKPNTWIKVGSTFVAKIESDAYRSISLSNENYIYTRTFQAPMTLPSDITKNSDVIETITYFDGLGRPMQNIGIKASPSIQDIVTSISYDSIGRQRKEFLPYMDTSVNLASYRNNAISNTNSYYIANYSADINSSKPNPFSEKEFERSPLNRIIKQGFPGSDWALGNGHEIKLEYQTNQANEVKQYYVTSQIGSSIIDSKIYASPYYPTGSLNKKITKDENWVPADGNNKTIHEFMDKEGHLVLKRTFGASKVNDVLTNVTHDTYYIYDEYGNLITVIPPLADTDALFVTNPSASGYDDFSKTFNQSIFSGTTSGGGSVYVTITNNVLKVVFSGGYNTSFLSNTPQDLPTTPCTLPDMNLGLISNGDYNASIVNGKLKLTSVTGAPSTEFSSTFTVNLPTNCINSSTEPDPVILNNLCYQYKYDVKNRLIEKKLPGKDWEYIVYDKLDRPILTQDANLRVNKKWLFTKYDALNRPVYTGEYVNTTDITRIAVQTLADNSNTVVENKQTSALNILGTNLYYSNSAFPNSGIDLFTINYYDDYTNIDLDGGTSVSSYGITPISNAKGLSTCSKVRVLGTSNWITSVHYYDNKGRTIYDYNKNNFLNSIATVKTQLDFGGKILETTSTHKKGTDALITIVDSYSYDHAGRVLTQSQSINNQTKEIIANNTYDKLGQLISKGVGGKINQSRLQNVTYNYNIRGWLKGINNIYAIGTNLFAFQINYNDITDSSKKLYNGNISQTSWKTVNIDDNSLKNYTYTYDALNRLTQAIDNSALNPGRYNEGLSYDKNSNIKSILRLGHINTAATTFGTMDNLTYTYTGNRLDKVEDSSGSTEGFSNGANIPIEYTYDNNGNMKTDANKGITAISYNHLNLPTSVSLNGGTISYFYDATGIKQRKTISTGGSTDYAGSFIYENNSLKQFSQPEGYITYNTGIYNYIYQYKDHLGNIRLSYQDKDNNGVVNKSEIVQENNYYAFGLMHKGYNNGINGVDNKYKYNGKELQDELGLNMYDYTARNYDPALGRWMNIDALSELSRRWSPYSYCYSNPVRYVDPDGMLAKSVIDDLISKSDNDKETKWTFNNDGTATGSNGRTANTEENQEETYGPGDGPGFGHKPKEPTSIVGKFFNKIGSKIDKQKTALANKLANRHAYNERLIMAYSFVMEALIETTEAGDLLTNIRESMVDTYGNQQAKEVSEVYSNVLSIVKQIKEDAQGEGGKLVDSYVIRISAAIGAKAVGLQIQNNSIALTIKGLDKNVYYNRRIDPADKGPEVGGFSGGGSGGYYGDK
ncbi:hypothetical protein ASE21_20910 [Flavobacterium sp. Root901]|uniref:DUF6443 domain-containing protein n=1 Tax=Flavobacterium sp. Root901 TaxID=1736605 RepID=UPI00070C9475|nr:DUF6443 domain-containing protein [Flavobacterium sp. Root901]KRD05420.1 hypothetical protein ASE21_20910 [Flavobacterium sp. Root901]